MPIAQKRAYEKPDKRDGTRVLVDRIWPRGLKKEDAQIHLWLKDIAPSTALRKWFGHDPDKWAEFKKRYFEELENNPEPVRRLRDLEAAGKVTLVFSAKDEIFNNAVALNEYLFHLRSLPKAE